MTKKLTIEITDEAALAEAYPELLETVTKREVNRQALYPIAKAFFAINKQIPGVKAYYANDGQADELRDVPNHIKSDPNLLTV